ncbi:hypothetical protein [Streptomyces sp. NPDC057302]|uniref:hypothetical protein n=1 Tax=Streptomyces sp. NPDC057302 TaxID=3346094 RepID=UPI00364257E2
MRERDAQEREFATSLARSGLKYLGMVAPSTPSTSPTPLIPPNLASFANSTAAEGREVAVSLRIGLPDLPERVNAEWYGLSTEQGLFSAAAPEFLLSVPGNVAESPHGLWWARVTLEAEWDLAGAGAAAGVTGSGWGYPEFVMLSVAGDVIVRGSTGEEYTDCVALRDPQRIRTLRDLGADMAHWPHLPKPARDAVSRWLEHTETP